MSPLFIEIMIWHYCTPTPYRDGDYSAPAVIEAIGNAIAAGLMIVAPEPGKYGSRYSVTDGGEMYIKALCQVPLPIKKWVMP